MGEMTTVVGYGGNFLAPGFLGTVRVLENIGSEGL